MGDRNVEAEPWRKANPAYSEARTSLASSLEDSWSFSPSSSTEESLECNEDMADEDFMHSDDCGLGTAACQGGKGLHRRVAASTAMDGFFGLIKFDLQLQAELYNVSPEGSKDMRDGSFLPGSCEAACSKPHPPRYDGGRNRFGFGIFGWTLDSLNDRRLLVGWMHELMLAARLERETLFCATSLLDRYLIAEAVRQEPYPPGRVLQLLALACVSVAMKFEEVAPLQSSELLHLAVDPETGSPFYQAGDLSRMEWLLLDTLRWRTRAPNAHSFLQHFLLCHLQYSEAVADCACSREPQAAGTGNGSGADSPGSGGRDVMYIPLENADGGCGCAVSVSASASAAGQCPPPSGTSVHCKGCGAAEGRGGGGYAGRHGSAACWRAWEGELHSWAARLLDLAIVTHCDVVHRHSTVAMSCLVLAERACVSIIPSCRCVGGWVPSAAAVLYCGGGSACCNAVQAATGLPLEVLAPDLAACVILLERAWAQSQPSWSSPPALVTPPSAPLPPPLEWSQPTAFPPSLPPPPQQQQGLQPGYGGPAWYCI